jgi:ABC-type nitrate/sulfonate/bicarbonate transport system substrate-binding protein
MKKVISIIMILFLMLPLSACKKEEKQTQEKPLQKITFVLDWTPNTNHTGVYAAKEKGFFKEAGFDVDIIQPGKNTSDQLIAEGKAQFGISYQENVTYAREQNMPLVSIAAVVQHNTSAFAWPSNKDIKTPKDFEGKTYAGWGSPIEEAVLKSITEKYGGDFSKVNVLTTDAADFFALTEKDADFAWIYYGWTGIASKVQNKSIDYIMLKDEDKDLDYYTPVIITSEKMISENRDTVKRFMEAVSKGYDYAEKNPEDAAQILLKEAPELDKTLVIESQKWLSPRYKDDAKVWGYQKRETWENYTRWLYDRKLINTMIDVDKAFTNEFIPEK